MIRFLFALALILPMNVYGQRNTEEAAVMQPVTALFAGMNKGDSAMVRSAFASEITMVTVTKDKSGKSIVRRESSLAGFLKAIGTPHPEPYNEPIWDVAIQVDGNFAQVWAKYAFYLGKKFSHCGVDAFQLVNYEDGWKIIHLADTRQTLACKIPAAISEQFK